MTWGFPTDENLEPAIARYLQKEDHHAVAVQLVDELGKGTDDEEILRYADARG